ncbi:DNA repair protein RecN [Boudabousia liubingyangii]|uniref:DNA repair protein RecN n=1 Tax=Boudabousia liubingyangii TaxID=1921764 RepID=UPI000939A55C|nr:DNA repair protein RecN [Boudabousia liubingyangii]OKL47576.1 DNA repair protein RecN [Boudabousia liubingyangii]
MLSEITIQNVGVIDQAHLELGPGLTTITGETGAGKTMVLSGLGLLLGGRADASVVRLGAKEARVNGVFDLSVYRPEKVLTELDLELEADENEIIVNRTLSAQGRSRGRIQGLAQPISALAQLGQEFVTVHGQSDQIALKQAQVQRDLLDQFGGAKLETAKQKYREAWAQAVQAKRTLDEWQQNAAQYELEASALQQGLDLVNELAPKAGEEEELKTQIERLSNVHELSEHVQLAAGALRQPDLSPDASSLTQSAANALEKASGLDNSLSELASRAHQLSVQLADLADEVENYLDNLSADPEALSRAHARRAKLNRALAGRAADIPGLLAWAQEAAERLAAVGDTEGHTQKLTEQLHQAQENVWEAGRGLSQARAEAAQKLGEDVTAQLASLAMPNAQFTVALNETPKPKSHGLEDIVFNLQAHPHAPQRPLAQGASGGELSRVMLALEVALAQASGNLAGRTFIFDEVDSGVGGQAAIEVGRRLAQLAKTAQVIVVTHLPQVAAFADAHVKLEKTGNSTSLQLLDESQRAAELARMLSGEATPEAARAHGLELLKVAKMAQSKM